MKIKFLTIFAVFIATCSVYAGNVITYTASSKLSETNDQYSAGLHTYAFNVAISSHTFSNGTGTITFSGNVTRIGNYAFHNSSNLTSITIPNSVTSIGDWAFYGCSKLASVTIPDSVTSIGNYAFIMCSNLSSITIPDCVTNIGERAFFGCTSFIEPIYNSKFFICLPVNYRGDYIIPQNIEVILEDAFYNCSNLTSLTIPNSVSIIGDRAFMFCSNLTSIIIPNCVTEIGEQAFEFCTSLMSITIPDSITNISNYTFDGCHSLSSITIPHNVKSIGDKAFSDCVSLTSLMLADGVKNIGKQAFEGCAELLSLTIPSSITSISDSAFWGCNRLMSIICNGDVLPSIKSASFGGVNPSIPLTFSCSARKSYIQSPDWQKFYNLNVLNEIIALIQCDNEQGEILLDGSPIITISTCKDESLTIQASPQYGYHFDNWSDGNTENPRTITLQSDTTFTATFAPNTYIISTSATEGGMTKGDTSVLYREPVIITAIPNYGYEFSHWGDGNTNNPRTVFATEDATYEAQFVKTHFHVSASSDNTTMGYVTGGGSYLYQDNVTIQARAEFGYAFKQWNDGNTDNPRIVYLESDTAFMALFYKLHEGPCGDNLTWKYDTKMLTISGTGDMYDYNNKSMPWLLLCDSISNVVIEQGVTSIGDYAFYGCQNRAFTKLVMPQSVKKIGHHAFANCNRLTSIVFSSDMEEVGDYAFSGCTRINDMTCYATVTPDAAEHTFDGVNRLAYLYVQAGSKRTYELDPYWGEFDIHEIGAESTTVTGNSVQIEPSDNEAVFTWPMAENADTYSLSITKDGEVFCTLTFNANGQLIGLAFAPSLDGSANAPAATLTENGYQFTVTGLDYATNYAFSLNAKDAASQIVASYSGSFHTNGATALENISIDVKAEKQIIDGVLYIIRDGVRYTATGQRAE